MANAVEVDIAEAIVTALNAETFDLSFVAERSYADWNEKLEGIGKLKVDVVPWSVTPEQSGIGSIAYTCETDILIRKRFDESQKDQSSGRVLTSEVDALAKLRQDIYELFMPCLPSQTGRNLTTLADATWQATVIKSSYVRPHMKIRQFTSWLRVTYRYDKAVG